MFVLLITMTLANTCTFGFRKIGPAKSLGAISNFFNVALEYTRVLESISNHVYPEIFTFLNQSTLVKQPLQLKVKAIHTSARRGEGQVLHSIEDIAKQVSDAYVN